MDDPDDHRDVSSAIIQDIDARATAHEIMHLAIRTGDVECRLGLLDAILGAAEDYAERPTTQRARDLMDELADIVRMYKR